ncbi:MAG: helix-turn-helix transcriptional regulator [Kiritimatiellia bacterium]|nr:AraC family transcriptional regulator [Lentisphaerota bacterium]
MPKERHGWMAQENVLRLGIWFDVMPAAALRADAGRRMRYLVREPLEALLQEAQSQAGGRRERMTARVLLLLSPLLELLQWPEIDAQSEEASEPDNRITRLVDRFFEDNMTEPLALRDVAQQMNMSMPTLTRQVRAETGKSVMHRLHEMRMKRAATLLTNSESSVKEVAARVGIPEPSYFCRCFRRYFGRSPRQFSKEQPEMPGQL